MSKIKVGDILPKSEFKTMVGEAVISIDSESFFKNRKVLIIGVIGAFTPVCSNQHLPDFIPFAAELKSTGMVDETVCLCVVDPFVLRAWGQSMDPDGELMMLTDNNAEFATKTGLSINCSGLGLGLRSTRFAMLVDNGVVLMMNIEKDPEQVEVTSSATIAKFLGIKYASK